MLLLCYIMTGGNRGQSVCHVGMNSPECCVGLSFSLSLPILSLEVLAEAVVAAVGFTPIQMGLLSRPPAG